MPDYVIASLKQARILALTGLVIGGMAAWYGLLTEDGAEQVAKASAQFLLPLGILILPTVLLFINISGLDGNTKTKTDEQKRDTNLMLLIAGGGGAIAGIALFLLVIPLGAGSVGGEDLNAVRESLWEQVSAGHLILIFVVNILVALGLAGWMSGESNQ